MEKLRPMTVAETTKVNGGGAVGFAFRLFLKIVFTPGKVY